MKPDKKGEEASAKAKGLLFKRPLETDQPEYREREEGHDELRVDMDGVEEDRRSEAVQGPELKRCSVSFPLLLCKKKYLESEEDAEKAHAEAHDKREDSPVEK